MGLVAFGKTARSLVKKLRAFIVDVLVYDPYVSESEMAGFDVTRGFFRDLLKQSDPIPFARRSPTKSGTCSTTPRSPRCGSMLF